MAWGSRSRRALIRVQASSVRLGYGIHDVGPVGVKFRLKLGESGC